MLEQQLMTHHPYKISFDFIKANYKSIKNFGLGFIQIKMNNGLLFNVYKDDLPKFKNVSSPHNHQSDFTSTILHGFVFETIFDVTKGDKPAFCGCGSDIEITETYDYNTIDFRMYQQGSTYLRIHNEFHSIAADNNTITMVTEFGDVLSEAIVIGDKTHEVILQIAEEELLIMVKEAFDEYSFNMPPGTELIVNFKERGVTRYYKQDQHSMFLLMHQQQDQSWINTNYTYNELSVDNKLLHRVVLWDKNRLQSKP